MITFYQGSGSSEIDLLPEALTTADWNRLKIVAERLLERKGQIEAATFLRENNFILHHGTNGFADEFKVLYMKISMDSYVDMAGLAIDHNARHACQQIVHAMSELNQHVRFVAMELDTSDALTPVAAPSLAITSDVVDRALRDAERLIASEGATSGVDRVHTAFHGYLRGVVGQAGIVAADSAGITDLFKLLRDQHPTFQQARVRQADLDKILRSLANVVDSLNPLRNLASVAHPNSILLEEPEAMLVINSVRSLLHYINSRTAS